MSLTAKLENLKITRQDLRKIHYDTRISKNELKIDGNTSLFIANNGNVPITDQHQMYAKGIVYEVTYDTRLGHESFSLIAMPYVKFYNAFEDVCVSDLKDLEYNETEVVKKQDGTMIARWVYGDDVYFSTRGNILTPDKLFYKPVMTLALLNYTSLTVAGEYDEYYTYLLEYVGPSNVILEPYEKDDLILTGEVVIQWDAEAQDGWWIRYWNPSSWEGFSERFLNVPVTPTYDTKDPKEVLASMTGIQEGVIVNYLGPSGNIVYRVKFKHEEYIKALKSRSYVDKLDPILLLIENEGNIQKILNKLESELRENPFREELVHAVEVKLGAKETHDAFAKILSLRESLRFEAEALKFCVEDGVQRKQIYEMASKVVVDGKNWAGLLMSLVYKDVDTVTLMKQIYKQLG